MVVIFAWVFKPENKYVLLKFTSSAVVLLKFRCI